MSPLDDELHKALHTRAGLVAPPADPLGGIERRARGIRRRRLTATLAGGALALAAAGVAVPALLPERDRGGATQVATSPTPDASDYALDPASPWAARGTDPAPGFRQAWLAKHPGTTFAPLFSQVYEPSQQTETAFVSDGPDGARFGYAVASGSTTTFWYDDRLADSTAVLSFLLPGDEVRRLVVVAAPGVKGFSYGGTAMTALADGVAVAPVEGTVQDLLVRAPDGQVLFDGQPKEPQATTAAEPTNLLDWPTRGAGESDLMPAARRALAPSLGASEGTVELKILFAGDTDSGVRFLMGQAWKKGGSTAHPFSYAEGGTNGPMPFLGPANDKAAPVLAFVLDSLPGTVGELLVVIPDPRTGQVLYDDDAAGAFRPITGQDHLDGVVLIDRASGETDDRLQVLDGNGDLDHPTYEGPVAPLLCGVKECG